MHWFCQQKKSIPSTEPIQVSPVTRNRQNIFCSEFLCVLSLAHTVTIFQRMWPIENSISAKENLFFSFVLTVVKVAGVFHTNFKISPPWFVIWIEFFPSGPGLYNCVRGLCGSLFSFTRNQNKLPFGALNIWCVSGVFVPSDKNEF